MRRVVKLGGSLLSRPDLQTSLQHWVSVQERAETLVIAGGGELIDAIRRLDAVRPVDEEATHWACVELLHTTFLLMREWFDWPSIDHVDDFDRQVTQGFSVVQPTLIDVRVFYDRDLEFESWASLPNDWRTTTDSIAALLALRSSADELVLLKSCEVDPVASPTELAKQGIVDEAFPTVPIDDVHLRVERLV